jgi:hypothetical protein
MEAVEVAAIAIIPIYAENSSARRSPCRIR